MALIQYDDDLYAKSSKVADVHDEPTMSDIFIKKVDSYVCHSMRQYWVTHQQADKTNISFTTKSLAAIQERFPKPLSYGNHSTQSKPFAISS